MESYYTRSYGAYRPEHGTSRGGLDEFINQARRTGSIRHIDSPTGKKLLDVGAGGGMFLNAARELGAEVTGVEPDAESASRCRDAGITVFNGTLESNIDQVRTRSPFDIITANHVLEHVPDPIVTLKTMKSLLADSGFIWIAVPNGACLGARSLKWRWHSTDLPFHFHQFNPQSLRRAAGEAGLHVRRFYTYSLPSSVAASVQLFLRYKLLIPRSLTQSITRPDGFFAPWIASRLDRDEAGEAIIAEFVVDSEGKV
ncbi:MAG TPA: class I SAM-dependent methyltransferase [Tepidisphaeraceae bacterium]|jgi:SAM-dependent methyltransferase